jgi:hypothetical protein
MKTSYVLSLLLVVVLGACASGAGSSPSVPKPTIEKAADTKIADAGPDNGDAAAR